MTGETAGGDADAALLARTATLRERVAALVERRSATDPTANDPLRGLYLSETAIRHLLHPAGERPATADTTDGNDQPPPPYGPLEGTGPPDGPPTDRLDRLAVRTGLTTLDTHILLIALAPDLDRTFEPLYGYLNDDVSRRRATIGLALDLCGLPTHLGSARARFHPTALLRTLDLLTVEEPELPFLSRPLRVPDRVLAHLLGDDTPDAVLADRLRPAGPVPDDTYHQPLVQRLAKRLAAAPLTTYLREQREGDALACAVAALGTAGRDLLHFSAGPEPQPARELLREARLRDRALLVSALPDDPGPLIRALTAADVPVLFAGSQPYEARWCDGEADDPLILDVPALATDPVRRWSAELGLHHNGVRDAEGDDDTPDFDLAATVAPYRLGGDRLRRAARSALDLAAFDDTALTADHLRCAIRQQTTSGLERLAHRIRPAVTWHDLVLPEHSLDQLQELALRARHRERVLGDWRLNPGGGRGRGVLGLFAGESGTGKTLSAEVVAAELGLDLYVVQLSSVIDKYVGETEKNLERIFTEADRTDAILLFDEADAVFGKRSSVNDSHDRYANLESAYLLQRLESFDGVALLTTNLRSNIDEAFTRRLDLVVDFPFPDAEHRLALWRYHLTHVPCAEDADPGPCARDFELTGGAIRSAAVTAAYAAVSREEPVGNADLRTGAEREYRKAGRLVMADSGRQPDF